VRLLIAIVQDQDSPNLLFRLAERNIRCTKLASTGGFLRGGNTTILIGVEEEQVDETISIIRETCHARERYIDLPLPATMPTGTHAFHPIEVIVGGATIFVLEAQRFFLPQKTS